MRITKLIAGASVALAMTATPAFAQSTGTVNLSGTVQPKCTIALGATAGSGTSATTSITASGDLSSNDGNLNAAAFGTQSQQFTAMCNGPSTYSASASALTTPFTGTVPAGFTNSISFTADLGSGVTVNSGATIPATAVPGPYLASNNISLGNLSTSGGARPVAGTYTGTITVTIAANALPAAPLP